MNDEGRCWSETTLSQPAMNETTRLLEGKVAIVTGASSGIGRATSIQLARAGAVIVAVGRDAGRLQSTIDAARTAGEGTEGLALSLDVGSDEDMQIMARRSLERYGRIDILVASASVLRPFRTGPKAVVDTTVQEWTNVIRTNLRGLFLSNHAVLPAMIGQKSGDIVNLSSTSGLRGYAYDGAYCASKFATIGFTEALAEEVRTFGVRVHTLLPGPVATEIWIQNLPVPPPEKTIPVERVADMILHMLTLPRDAVLLNPILIPMRTHRRPAHRASGPGASTGRKEDATS